MAYTVKQLLESKQFPDMRLVICKENLNQEIKGIRIIEIEVKCYNKVVTEVANKI